MIQIFNPDIPFEEKAISVFNFQKRYNPIYSAFCDALGIVTVERPDEIPLLPISAFKETVLLSTVNGKPPDFEGMLYFQSSGTSGMQKSTHYLPEPKLYEQALVEGMQNFYSLDDYVIWAYTPGYSENPHSSLVWMLKTLISREASGFSRFLELNKPLNREELEQIEVAGKKLMIFGAAFGLLDLLELEKTMLPADTIIMETGGMKTHRREMTKGELHQVLAEGFGLPPQNIHSEYGMAELLSQAYSTGSEWFKSVPWMRFSIRNPDNPAQRQPAGEEGLIGVIDLANIYSCAFILTGDKGVSLDDGRFQVLGRWNPGNLRGCNFLIDRD